MRILNWAICNSRSGGIASTKGILLLGVVVYGSTALDSAATTGHNVLVVVRSLDVTSMRAGGAIGRSWQEAGNAVPLTLTEAEWQSSAVVVAIEHADIAERNRVVFAAGSFALADRGAVRDADLRRQLEYESLAQVLAVRAGITAAGRDVRDQRALLAAQASRAVAMFRAGVRLAGGAPAPDAEALCIQAGTLAGFDPEPFVAALRQRRGTKDVPKGELEAVLGGFHTGLMRFEAYVDSQPERR